MSSSRLAAILGPLIVLLLVGGITAAVLEGDDDTELAQDGDQDGQDGGEFDDGFDDGTDGDAAPDDGFDAGAPDAGTGEPPGDEPAGVPDTQAPDDGVGPAATGSPTPAPSPTEAPGIGDDVAVDDPTALTGGWAGGTPNTGTTVSAVGLLLLVVGGGLLWLRRARA